MYFIYCNCTFRFYPLNGNQRIECLIKNYDWKNNPSNFEYKLNETDTIHIGDLTNIKEFGINNDLKYLRVHTRIDVSPSDLNNLTTFSNPEWSEETMFLKLIVKGNASLYSYEGKSIIRFFYSTEKTDIQQLIYKEYNQSDNTIAKNNGYRQQLWNDVRLKNASMNSFGNMSFTRNQLEKYFIKYNQQNQTDQKEAYPIQTTTENSYKKLLTFKLKSGLSSSNLQLSNVYGTVIFNYKFTNSYRLGFDIEGTSPFLRNKWSLTIEPSIERLSTPVKQYYRDIESKLYSFSVDYQTINIPIGIRYYMFLNDKSRLFVNGYIVYDLNTRFSLNNELTSDDKSFYFNFALGGGYEYRKLSVEFRYYTQNEIYNNNFWSANYNKLFLNIGYRFLEINRKK